MREHNLKLPKGFLVSDRDRFFNLRPSKRDVLNVVFINPIAGRLIEGREEHEKMVASCEGDRCIIKKD